MKKKVLLSVIPAFMLLGSCAGAAPKADLNLFQEDNLLHEEIFGSVEGAFRKNRQNAPSVDDSIPYAGVQMGTHVVDEVTYLAVRFIAAIKVTGELEDTTAVWTRTMYKNDGSPFRTTAPKASKTAYKSVYVGENEFTITQLNTALGGTEYTDFVVYTMLKIPNDGTYSKYSLDAYLTVNNTVNSLEVFTTLDAVTQFSYEAGETGYFIGGTINGQVGSVAGVDEEGYDASFTLDVRSGDKFNIFHKDGEGVELWDANSVTSSSDPNIKSYFEANANGLITPKNPGTFTLRFLGDDLVFNDLDAFIINGDISDWNRNLAYALERDPADPIHYSLTGLVFDRDEKFKIVDNEASMGWYTNASEWGDCQFYFDLSGNICVRYAGTYNLHFYNDERGNKISLEPTSSNLKKYYIVDSNSWGQLYFYTWTGSGVSTVKNHDWPGYSMLKIGKNEFDQDIYQITADISLYTSFIVNNNNGHQTSDTLLSGFDSTHNAAYMDGNDLVFINYEGIIN